MFVKRIAALAAAIAISLSAAITSFAAMDLDEYDGTMYSAVKQLIEEEADQDIRDTELEILEAIHAEIASQGASLASQKEGAQLIKKIASDKSLWASQWIAAFQKACDQYGVPSSVSGGLSDADSDADAVNKLHILHGIRILPVHCIRDWGYPAAGDGKERVHGSTVEGVFKAVRGALYHL